MNKELMKKMMKMKEMAVECMVLCQSEEDVRSVSASLLASLAGLWTFHFDEESKGDLLKALQLGMDHGLDKAWPEMKKLKKEILDGE